jgi:glycerophosphoryl diester phosphodiesterase
MKSIIGHRGAAGLALENSLESFRTALEYGVESIEFDIRRTKDNKLVVLHDADTGRVATKNVKVSQKTLDELRHITLNNGERLPSLDEVLDILGNQPMCIEIKDNGCVGELLRTLDRHPKAKAHVSVVSFEHNELQHLRERRPEIPIYVLEHYSPFEIIHTARRLHAEGIGLNKTIINPIAYLLARRYGLKLYVYTVNSKLQAWFLHVLYPGVQICTNHPELFKQRVKQPERSTHRSGVAKG